MTKAEIIEQVHEQMRELTKREAADLVEMVFETMKKTLEEGEKLKISGFGNFVVRMKKERVGRNPKDGSEIKIAPRRVLTFKPSQVLKSAINQSQKSTNA